MENKLCESLDTFLSSEGSDFFKDQVPEFIYANLREGFGKRPYQQEAFGRFVFYYNSYMSGHRRAPVQLLYHMATGSGKTLIMAGLILFLYGKGYRNFLFFVNSTNIIDKTRDNFLNASSSKYLFSKPVTIGDRLIRIKEVNNFQSANQNDINIVFSTIQGLHARLNTPRENSVTFDDLEDQNIVLISDEAHHINAETKKGSHLSDDEKRAILSWEGTVNQIFKLNPSNILLEFTATADFSMVEIENKYNDKLLFDYSLKQFRHDKFSKEVKVMQTDLPPFERALQGMLLSQYRRKIFESFGIQIKPVVLFKSRTIRESEDFFVECTTRLKKLDPRNLQAIKATNADMAIQTVFRYLETNNISLDNFVSELKEDFSESKLISVNSKDESEKKQIIINSLEDRSNFYRGIFAVDKLNEGWDVLNLFDIVRLYDTKNASKGTVGKTTMAEAQLIGRGARYCPFQVTPDQPYFQRKLDDDPGNALRICEELYYHSAYNPGYIMELNTALKQIGIKDKSAYKGSGSLTNTRTHQRKVGWQQDQGLFPGKGMQQTSNPGLRPFLVGNAISVRIYSGSSLSINLDSHPDIAQLEIAEKKIQLSDIGDHIIRKAIQKLKFYQFSNLKKIFPPLKSVSEFIHSKDYLASAEITVSGTQEHLLYLSTEQKLFIVVSFLDELSSKIRANAKHTSQVSHQHP